MHPQTRSVKSPLGHHHCQQQQQQQQQLMDGPRMPNFTKMQTSPNLLKSVASWISVRYFSPLTPPLFLFPSEKISGANKQTYKLIIPHQDRNQLCKIPVTHDFPANPFRCDTTPSLLSIHQTHAIVAITLQYLSRAPSPVSNQLWLRHVAKRERELACKGRKQSGGGEVFCSSEFLDTLLVLVTLEVSFFLFFSFLFFLRFVNLFLGYYYQVSLFISSDY